MICFHCRLKTSCLKIVRMLNEACGDEVLGNSVIRRWHVTFMKEHESAELTPHSSRPSTACMERNVNTVSVLIEEDRHLSTRAL